MTTENTIALAGRTTRAARATADTVCGGPRRRGWEFNGRILMTILYAMA
jgi:hypothetical protein